MNTRFDGDGSEHFTELIHHFSFVFGHTVDVSIQRDGCILMTEDFRQGFHIHSAFECPCRKGVAERMKALHEKAVFLYSLLFFLLSSLDILPLVCPP